MHGLRLTLTAKLAAINLLLVLSLVAVAAVAWRMLPGGDDSADDMARLSRAQRANQHADMLHDAMHAGVLESLLADQLPRHDHEALQRTLARDVADFRAELRTLQQMQLPAALGEPLEAARSAGEAYALQVESTARAAQPDRRRALAAWNEFERHFDGARVALGRFTEALTREIDAAQRRAAGAAQRARTTVALAALLALVLAFAAVGLIGRSIRRSLAEISDVAREVADGNLDRRSTGSGSDEVGRLSASVNRMADTLQQMIERMREEAEHGGFRAELAQALDMADSEPQACEAAARAMAVIAPGHPMELLLADSSDAHLARAAVHPAAGAPGCAVESPYGCVAVRSGHPMRFASGAALSACPRLRDRGGADRGDRSAVCVPVTFMGRALGVLHATAPVQQPVSDAQLDRLTALGLQFGSRIGTVRAFERTQLQASTDPLTGLANRRTVEKRLRELALRREPHALVMADLDHFKRLNDTHGHPAGDEALRVFAEAVRAVLRDGDLPGRWGGEEFAFVIAGMGAEQALQWTARLRERLAQRLSGGGCPPFTASFGVADSLLAASPEQLVRLADDALYRAKRDGRDRSAVAQPTDTVVLLRRESEHRAAVDLRMLADK
ncbi:MAG: sensor domain-containing diguanylate cyclase [Rubrivivax sp.]